MSLIDDPDMKEIVVEFCIESNELITQLQDTLDIIEEDPTQIQYLEQFGQVIDRMMGAAKSLGADEIATFCELGKVIGYKSSQAKDPALLEIVIAILFDCVDLLNKMLKQLETGQEKHRDQLNMKAFATRLKWLSEKFKHIERASCELSGEKVSKQDEIDKLLGDLGL